jgi:hypothetical protein
VSPDSLKSGDSVVRGLLYRWIPNTQLSYDYRTRKPTKMAFRPNENETGISVFLADLIQPGDVIHALDGYGVCQFTAEELLMAADQLRADPANKFSTPVTITFDPDSAPVKGHAHCYIDPMPTVLQKRLYKAVARMTAGYEPGPSVGGRRNSSDGDRARRQ